MANSRKLPLSAVLLDSVATHLRPRAVQRLAVAFSGGRDSSVLLDALAQRSAELGLQVFAFHIHHGLQKIADTWAQHCADFCSQRSIPFLCRRVTFSTLGQSVEAAARAARYEALRALALEHELHVVALGHHAHDQAETVLFNLARGAGSRGLAGMPVWREDRSGTAWWRPLLACSPEAIADYAEHQALSHVEDPTNANLDLARNRIRHVVLPALAKAVPGTLVGISRAACHAQEMLELERYAGTQALQRAREGEGVRVAFLASLPQVVRQAALRTWYEELGLNMPSEVQLRELWRQVEGAREDAQLCISAGTVGQFRRYRGCLFFDPVARKSSTSLPRTANVLLWSGQKAWQLPDWSGYFVFEATNSGQEGIPEALLASAPLYAKPRQGGERLRLSLDGHHRSLKQWYQDKGIPSWRRDQAPLLFLGEKLLFVPGVGCCVDALSKKGDQGCRYVRWVKSIKGCVEQAKTY